MQESVRLTYCQGDEEIGRVRLNLDDHEVVDLVVDEEYQQQGIATKLVESIERVARGLGLPRVWSTVAIDNNASNAIWRKRGYVRYNKWERRFLDTP